MRRSRSRAASPRQQPRSSTSLAPAPGRRRTCLAEAPLAETAVRRRTRGIRCEATVADALGNGRYLVSGRIAYAVREKRRVWVFIDGRTYVVVESNDRDAPDRVHVTDDHVALSAR